MYSILKEYLTRSNHLNRYILCLGVIFLLSTQIVAQSEDQMRTILASKVSTEEIVGKAETMLSKLKTNKSDSLHYLYQIYAYWLYDAVGKKEAIIYEKKALEFAKKRKQLDTSFAQRSAIFLAYYYVKDHQFLKSIDAYKEVILINNNSKHAITAYLKLGYSYFELQDYYNALKYYKLAVSLLKKNNGSLQKLREAYQNIASTCLRIKTIQSIIEGRRFGKLADSLSEAIPTSIENSYKVKYVLAQLHNRDEAIDFDTSLFYYNQANEIAKKEIDTTKLITTYLGYGILYKHFDNDKSIEYLEEALQYTRPSDNYHIYQIYTSLGFNHDIKKNFQKSVNYRHQALEYLTNSDFLDHKKSYDSLLIASENKINLLHAIPRLGESYLRYFEATKDPELLEKSIAYFLMADKVIDLLKLNSREYKSRLFWRSLSTQLYGKAIRACFLKQDNDLAFYFMEKNKALLLLEDIAKQNFNQSLELSSTYLKHEEQLRKDIYSIEANLKNRNTYTLSDLDSLEKLRIDLKIELSALQDTLTRRNKVFSFDPEIASLKQIQESLPDDEIVLEYHISIDDGFGVYTNNGRGYVLMISQQETQLFEIPNMGEVKSKTFELLKKIKKPFQTNSDIDEYAALSYSVYDLLFPSDALKKNILHKQLRIVPDSYLSLVPFEALSVTPENINYLITQNTVQYQYSNSFLQNIEKNHTQNKEFLAIVPEKFSNSQLAPLLYSSIETKNLKNSYSGLTLSGQNATKDSFLREMKNYGIIHLATHANAQDTLSPWIALADQKLSLEELYLTRNSASLVFLSGCNTTLGRQEIGEGVISLARGFFYSGAKSVISSLWSIDDKSTAEIVANFYDNLSKGQTKSKALQAAKINYLNTHSLSESSPYYWASFIIMGDNTVIESPMALPTKLLFLVLGVGLFFLLRRFILKNKK